MRRKQRDGLLNSFFAEACSLSGSLTGLKLRVAFADDVERALTLDHLTVFVAALHGEE